jgi:hypothetical protein
MSRINRAFSATVRIHDTNKLNVNISFFTAVANKTSTDLGR